MYSSPAYVLEYSTTIVGMQQIEHNITVLIEYITGCLLYFLGLYLYKSTSTVALLNFSISWMSAISVRTHFLQWPSTRQHDLAHIAVSIKKLRYCTVLNTVHSTRAVKLIFLLKMNEAG
jgi:hypothetical protein